VLEKEPKAEHQETSLKPEHLGGSGVKVGVAGGGIEAELEVGSAEAGEVGAESRYLHPEVGHLVLQPACRSLQGRVGD